MTSNVPRSRVPEPDVLSAVVALGPVVREHAPLAEQDGQLQPAVLDAMHDAGVFRMVVPRELGGLGVDLPGAQRVLEELAFQDGATGWCGAIASGGNAFTCWMDPAAALRVLAAPQAAVGGIFMPSGRAREVDGGYRVTGHWSFGSGCRHSTHMIGNCIVYDDEDRPRLLESGAPETVMMVFPREDYEIIDNWAVYGLRGTGSHDLAVSDVFVPHALTLRPFREKARWDTPEFRLPFQVLLWLWMAPVPLGVARCALDEVRQLASRKTPLGAGSGLLKDRPWVQARFAEATGTLEAARALLNEVTRDALACTQAGGDFPAALQARAGIAARYCFQSAVSVVSVAQELGGASALRDESRISRAFRDVNAAARHVAFGHGVYETSGGLLLGG